MVIAGTYRDKNKADRQHEQLKTIGYNTEVYKSKENLYQVIVEQTDTINAAQKIVNTLSEKGYEAWINLAIVVN